MLCQLLYDIQHDPAGSLPMPPGISGVPSSAMDPDLSTWRHSRRWELKDSNAELTSDLNPA
jgi:hypothetical protein